MRIEMSFFLTLSFLLIPLFGQAEDLEPSDYCYKPTKPLFFATAKNKKRYNEDMQEYKLCQQRFFEMQESAARMQKEAEENHQMSLDAFMKKAH